MSSRSRIGWDSRLKLPGGTTGPVRSGMTVIIETAELIIARFAARCRLPSSGMSPERGSTRGTQRARSARRPCCCLYLLRSLALAALPCTSRRWCPEWRSGHRAQLHDSLRPPWTLPSSTRCGPRSSGRGGVGRSSRSGGVLGGLWLGPGFVLVVERAVIQAVVQLTEQLVGQAAQRRFVTVPGSPAASVVGLSSG